MGKLVVLLCFAILAMTLVMACNMPGSMCKSDADCCWQFGCHPFKGICTGRPIIKNPWAPGGSLGAGIPKGPAY